MIYLQPCAQCGQSIAIPEADTSALCLACDPALAGGTNAAVC